MMLCRLLEDLDCTLVQGRSDIEVNAICCDSRSVTPGCVFVCLPGQHTDGRRFAHAAAAAGAAVLVFEDALPNFEFSRSCSPALVQADVGLAIGAGTDIAIESADIVLMKSSLADVASAAELSRAVLRNIRQNLFWAFFYNSVGIPVAAGVLYPALGLLLNPMIAAACMSLSSVCVVSNALRLRLWKPKTKPVPSAAGTAAEHIADNEEELTMKKTVTIEGMMCAHCVAHVEKALTALPGVKATVDLTSGTAVVEGDVTDEAIRAAVTDAGYTVKGIQ